MNGGSARPLLGLRREPGRFALAVFRSPLNAYHHDAGWMLGDTFLDFTHVGRKTGQPHEAVAMVLSFDDKAHEAVICAAWGSSTDWYQNLRAGPATSVQIGRFRFVPDQRFLSDDEAFDVVVTFRRAHPYRLRLLSAVLRLGDLRDDVAVRAFVRDHPFVAFRPSTSAPR